MTPSPNKSSKEEETHTEFGKPTRNGRYTYFPVTFNVPNKSSTYPKKDKIKEIRGILVDILNEMYTYGHFMSTKRMETLFNKIKKL